MSGNKASFGVFAGYHFNNNISAEIGYRSLGKQTFLGANVKTTQAAISVIGSYPINKELSAFGRLGYNNLKVDVDYKGYTGSASTTGVLLGLGLSYQFTFSVSARVEFQRPASDTKNLSVGLAYAF